jgi:hypothetical protein
VRSAAGLAVLLAASPAGAEFADHMGDPDDVGTRKVPRFGHSKVLVIRVDVGGANDWTSEERYFSPDWDDRDGFGPHTFRRYFQNVSAGRFDPEPVLPAPLAYAGCPAPDGNCALDLDFDRMYALLGTLIDDLRARDGLDLSAIDVNGPEGVPDGVLDGALVLLDPDDMDIGLVGAVSGVAGSSEAFVGGVPFERDGVVVNLWAYADTAEAGVDVAAHEFGHQIGFADSYFPGWELELSLMNACNLCSIDAHARILAGWADLEWIVEPGVYEIEPAFETGKVYRTGGETDFWLIENRQQVDVAGGAWDPTFAGLAIYHCDESLPFPQWALPPAEYERYHALTTNLWARAGDPPDPLFGPGDALLPADDHAPPSDAEAFQTDSNFWDGTRSDLAVEEIVDLGVTGGHDLPSLQARITPARGSIGPPVDAGPPDAGTDAAPDGGVEDAGRSDREDDTGCGCRQSGGAGWPAALIYGWMILVPFGGVKRKRASVTPGLSRTFVNSILLRLPAASSTSVRRTWNDGPSTKKRIRSKDGCGAWGRSSRTCPPANPLRPASSRRVRKSRAMSPPPARKVIAVGSCDSPSGCRNACCASGSNTHKVWPSDTKSLRSGRVYSQRIFPGFLMKTVP